MKILFVSLGCDKNLVDSEKMLGMLQEKGYTFTDDEAEADVVVVNTCCFIGDAKEESINTLLQMGELKDSGQVKALIAAGCLAQRYREEIQKEIPQVDAIIGTTAIDEIVAALEEILAGQKQNHYEDINAAPVTETNRVVTTGGHFAYLKIAEGCDKHCTYCIIPKVRGNYRSVPKESLLKEATELADKGVRELILVAQETTLYGMDLYGKKSLHILLQELAKIKEITIDSALNDATTLPKPILNKLLDKAIGEKVWSDEDINNFEEHKSNMNYVWNFLSDAAKVQLGELAMADKASITAEKMFGGLVEGRVSKQLKEICLLDQTYVKAEDGKQSVAKYLESVSKDLKITKMIRFEVGEGMEKKQEDFAAEVAAQMNA